jgi:ribosome-binding factor A
MGQNMAEAADALNENEYQFRKVLSQELTMKFLPKIRFMEDDTFYEANKIEALFSQKKVRQDLTDFKPDLENA